MNGSEELIPVIYFCQNHGIEVSFVHTLRNTGLIEIVEDEEAIFIQADKIPKLEKIIRLHFELDINLEGIEAISHLLERVENLQRENATLRNQLRML